MTFITKSFPVIANVSHIKISVWLKAAEQKKGDIPMGSKLCCDLQILTVMNNISVGYLSTLLSRHSDENLFYRREIRVMFVGRKKR